MKVMMPMQKQTNKKKYKRIIVIVSACIAALLIAVSIILFHLMGKPQIRLAHAMTNTINSAQNSAMNQRFGTYEMWKNMISGKQNMSWEDSDNGNVQIVLRRDAEQHRFLLETGISDQNFKLYVNKKTSLIYIGDKAIRIQYADNLITNMSNSSVVSLLGIDNETVYSFGQAYENCMRLAANNYTDDNGKPVNTDVIQKTVKYFMGMESAKEGRQSVSIDGQTQECDVYSILFDADDFNNYLDDCFGTHDMDLQPAYEFISKYMPQIDTIDNTADLVHDIKQFVDYILTGGDIRIYFAVNDSDELVKLYADEISDSNLSVSLSFYGSDYVAQNYEFRADDKSGRSLVFDKSDIDKNAETGITYSVYVNPGNDLPEMSAGMTVTFGEDTAHIDISAGDTDISRDAQISDCKNGSFMELTWDGESTGGLHIGCDPDSIDKPEYSDSLDIFDTDIISAYKFVSDIMKR